MVFSKENGSYDSTILLTVILDFVTHTVLVVVVLVSNARKYPRLVNFCRTLETIDQNFLQVPQNDRVGLKVTIVFILTATIIMTETILQYKYSSLQQMNLQQDEYFTLFYFFLLSMNFVFAVLLIQFTHVTNIIAHRFRKLNTKIIHVVRDFGKSGMKQHFLVISPGSSKYVFKV
ncbi:hypothetical protein J6590_100749 [Homalodisca vitripennis]|nr:hypothetical protein J6590_099898 [Homalodisca vitripennis]KAG8329081.1 hypothetical protein J6590_095383 [Homalodisca vitripennis]KAG8333912.1 hypothetical protein J6590_100749 [Homalodisca vitripennis]